MQKDVKYTGHKDTGISVSVDRGFDRYKVIVKIPKKSITDEIHIETSNFAINLCISNEIRNMSEDLVIKYSKGYNFAKYGYIRKKPSVEKFNSKQYTGSIKLMPKFYIPASRRATNAKLRNAATFSKMMSSNSKESAPSKYTPYKYSNISQPYSGGLVRPK